MGGNYFPTSLLESLNQWDVSQNTFQRTVLVIIGQRTKTTGRRYNSQRSKPQQLQLGTNQRDQKAFGCAETSSLLNNNLPSSPLF